MVMFSLRSSSVGLAVTNITGVSACVTGATLLLVSHSVTHR